MAGDLYIENITYDQFRTLKAAGATVGEIIFHADRKYLDYLGVLQTQLLPDAQNSRHHLPAHAYVTFDARNRTELNTYLLDGMNKARLDDFLKKCTRPLGIVSNKASLATWPGNTPGSAANMLAAALTGGNIIIEYYKYDGAQLLDVQREWQKENE